MAPHLLAEDQAPDVEAEPTLRLRKEAPDVNGSATPPREPLEVAARAFQAFLESRTRADGKEVEEWRTSFPGYPEHAQLFHDLHRHDPLAADRLAQAMTNMPAVGTEFLGFRLLAELGRGAFARVYLAEQADLANRHVVLKLAADIWGEAQTLAQLHHPNIIPIYSVHHCEPFQAVCMPFQGSITLQDVLDKVQQGRVVPTTGKYLIQAFQAAAGSRQWPAADADPRAPGTDEELADDQPPAGAGRVDALSRLSYVEAIVYLATELAAGLAHAHEHGIIHRDLKPANVLLTDFGQPLLLDFNVAEDTKLQAGASVAWVAGTLPYMAPEQLAAMQGGRLSIDARSDLYAFGIVMFEMLTGRYPFASRRAMTQAILEQMSKERAGPPPRLRCWNPAVSPALEAIVRRCLEPDPSRRYQTARELQEDLECQRSHRPLRHTPEPSLKERLGKWARRHPRLRTVAWVAGFIGVLLLGLGTYVMVREEQLAHMQELARERNRQELARDKALAAFNKFEEDVKTAQFLLYTRSLEPEQRDLGLSLGNRLVEDYGVLQDPSWQQAEKVQALSKENQRRLAADVAELLLLMARATLWQPVPSPPGNEVQDRAIVEKALRLNERAAECHTDVAASPALWQQRADLHDMLGQRDRAGECRAKAGKLTAKTAQDYFLLASDHLGAGRVGDAVPLLQKATRTDPKHFWAWFVLGNCYERLGRDARAEGCYGACIALWPSFAWANFNRGLAYFRQKENALALADFDKVIELQPSLAEAYLNRALAHQALQQHAEAERDLTQALERGFAPTRLYFLRARVREKLGDKEGAQQDHAEGLRRPPTDETSLLARGYAYLNTNPKAALADFEEALRLNPRSALALQNKAHVLAEKLGRAKEALEVLNKAVELYPDSTQARGGRGVVLARLGQRELAHKDARETLSRDTSPFRLYQVACIYALTAPNHPEDQLQAYQLLSDALRKGFGYPLLETDPDLAPLRGQPEFRRLVDAARALQPSANAAAPKKS